MTDAKPAAKPAVELVIFDCDGVLVDSEPITHRVYQEMLGELGLSLSDDDMFVNFFGTSTAASLQRAADLLGAPLPADFEPEYLRRSRAALAREVRATAGIEAVLDALPVPYCVASNGFRAKMEVTLGVTGLLPRFKDRIFSVEDVARPKPAPDLYLRAAEVFGVDPAHCVVVEDSPTGVAAGVAAHMPVFGFAAHTPAWRLKDAGAQRIFDAMTQLPALLQLPLH